MIKTKSQWRLFRLYRIANMEGRRVALKDKPHLKGTIKRIKGINVNLPIKDAIKNSKFLVLFDNTLALSLVDVKASGIRVL